MASEPVVQPTPTRAYTDQRAVDALLTASFAAAGLRPCACPGCGRLVSEAPHMRVCPPCRVEYDGVYGYDADTGGRHCHFGGVATLNDADAQALLEARVLADTTRAELSQVRERVKALLLGQGDENAVRPLVGLPPRGETGR